MMRYAGLLLLLIITPAAFAQDTINTTVPLDSQKINKGRNFDAIVIDNELKIPKTGPVDSSSLKYKISTVKTERTADFHLHMTGNFQRTAHPDTSLDNVHNYNPLYHRNAAFQDLGFHGSPSKSLIFDGKRKPGLISGVNYMDAYFMDPNEFNIYQAHNSYTAVQFTQGANELLWLKLIHTQNIKPNFNMGVDFQRMKHDGYYLRQAPSIFNTRIFGHFYGKKYARYHALASVVFNRSDIQESGGFRSDSLFEEVQVPVNIKIASARNKLANSSYSLTQYYRFGQKGVNIIVKDTNTLETDTLNTFKPSWQLFHRFNLERNHYTYTSRNRDTLFYKDFFNDSFSTFDSVFHRNISSEQGFGFADNEGDFQQWFSASFLIEAHRLYQRLDSTYYYGNTALKGNWKFVLRRNNRFIENSSKGILYLSGFNSGDYLLELSQWLSSTESESKKRLSVFAREFVQSYTQPFLYTHLLSNHLKWNTSLAKTQVRGLAAGILFPGNQRISAMYQSVSNYVYADTAVQVKQLSGDLHVLQVFADIKFRLGNFHFKNQLVYQSDNSDILRLPALCSKHSWYYQKNLKFRNPGKITGRMLFQIGVDAFYRSAWKADAWNPAARTFHLQDQTEIGNYPQLDVWTAAKVKTVDLYLKLEHANQGLMGARYYSTPHYALFPRSFRFGLLWRFF